MRQPGIREALCATAAAAVLALVVPSAQAACVNPGGTKGCYASIQDAIDNTPAGGRVLIRPGRYREQFTVAKALLVAGGGRSPAAVVIDGEHTGATASITAADVRLHNLTLWNAGSNLVAVSAGAAGARVTRSILRGAGGTCLLSASTGTRVLGTAISLCGGRGVDVSGLGFVMSASRVTQANGNCVQVSGGDAQLLGNRLRSCADDGIEITGANALVRGNQVRQTAYEGIYVLGDAATVRGNAVDGTGNFGITVTSGGPTVAGNSVANSINSAVRVSCPACTGASVRDNSAAWGSSWGFEILAAGAVNSLVAGNQARGFNNHGFLLGGSGPYTLRRNVAREIRGNCFTLDATVFGVLAERNRALSCSERGFDVASDNATLSGNTARDADIGFHVLTAASGASLDGNTATRTSYAFCEDIGGATALSGNSFAGSTCP